MRINIAKETVNNHSTEEVVAWVEKALYSTIGSGQDLELGESYRLGLVLANLGEIVLVMEALNKKLNHKDDGPVVA